MVSRWKGWNLWYGERWSVRDRLDRSKSWLQYSRQAHPQPDFWRRPRKDHAATLKYFDHTVTFWSPYKATLWPFIQGLTRSGIGGRHSGVRYCSRVARDLAPSIQLKLIVQAIYMFTFQILTEQSTNVIFILKISLQTGTLGGNSR
jgi:hypothetical protein